MLLIYRCTGISSIKNAIHMAQNNQAKTSKREIIIAEASMRIMRNTGQNRSYGPHGRWRTNKKSVTHSSMIMHAWPWHCSFNFWYHRVQNKWPIMFSGQTKFISVTSSFRLVKLLTLHMSIHVFRELSLRPSRV